MGEITCSGCKKQTPSEYISKKYISDGFCGLCCNCVSERLEAEVTRLQIEWTDSEISLQKRIEQLEAMVTALKNEMLEAPSQTCSTIFGKPYSEWKAIEARVAELEGALKPFSQPDLCLRLGGNSPRDGDRAIVFQRNKAVLRLADFDAAKQALGESDEQ